MSDPFFTSVEKSDIGRKRTNNEDACLRIPEHGVYLIADGMGGMAGGDVASGAIIASLTRVFGETAGALDRTFTERISRVRRGTDEASKWILEFSKEKLLGQMGSTLVVLVFDPLDPSRAAGLHAGDSRLYRYREGLLRQLTADHSVVAALSAKLGRDVSSMPFSFQNELLRCVGVTESVELERTPVDVQSGDLFLLCSDGLTRMLQDEAIATILGGAETGSIEAVANALITGANDAGGKDNVSVVLVKVGDISAAPRVRDPLEVEEVLPAAAPAPAETREETLDPKSDGFDMPDSREGDTPRTMDDETSGHTPTPSEVPNDPTMDPTTPSADAHAPAADAPTPTGEPPTPTLDLTTPTGEPPRPTLELPNAEAGPGQGTGPAPAASPSAKRQQKGRNSGALFGVALAAAALLGAGIWVVRGGKDSAVAAAPIAAQSTEDQGYGLTMQAAHRALNGRDFVLARDRANAALAVRPGDAAASALRDAAQRQMDLAADTGTASVQFDFQKFRANASKNVQAGTQGTGR